MSTDKIKKIKRLEPDEKSKILHLVAEGYSVRDIAKDFSIRYASVRHVVINEWRDKYPDHFAEHGDPPSMIQLRRAVAEGSRLVVRKTRKAKP
jgi:transposase-like protein